MVTINCDMGESFGIYAFGDDAACMPFVTHANIACGFHASDPVVMRDTLRKAKAAGINVGSHPGLPDRLQDEDGLHRRNLRGCYLRLHRRLDRYGCRRGIHCRPRCVLHGEHMPGERRRN